MVAEMFEGIMHLYLGLLVLQNMGVYFAAFSFINSQGCIKLQLTMNCHSAEQLIQEFAF